MAIPLIRDCQAVSSALCIHCFWLYAPYVAWLRRNFAGSLPLSGSTATTIAALAARNSSSSNLTATGAGPGAPPSAGTGPLQVSGTASRGGRRPDVLSVFAEAVSADAVQPQGHGSSRPAHNFALGPVTAPPTGAATGTAGRRPASPPLIGAGRARPPSRSSGHSTSLSGGRASLSSQRQPPAWSGMAISGMPLQRDQMQ